MNARHPILRHREEAEGIGIPQIRLGGERKPGQVRQGTQIVGMDSGRVEFARVPGIVGIGMRQRRTQPVELQGFDFIAARTQDGLQGQQLSNALRTHAWTSARYRGRPPSKLGPALLARRGQPLAHVRQLETQEFERQRGIETGSGQSQPIVQGVLGPADRGGAARGQGSRHIECPLQNFAVGNGDGDEPDPLRFGARQGLVGQQVIPRLRQAAEQRPDDHGMIARGDPQPGVAVEYAGIVRGDRHIGQQGDGQACAHRAAADGRHHGFGTIDQVVDQVARLLPDADQSRLVVDHAIDHVEIAAGGEVRPVAPHDDHAHGIVDVDGAPHQRQIAMHGFGGGVDTALVGYDEFENSGLGRQELKTGKIPRVAADVHGRLHSSISGRIGNGVHADHGEHLVGGHRLPVSHATSPPALSRRAGSSTCRSGAP